MSLGFVVYLLITHDVATFLYKNSIFVTLFCTFNNMEFSLVTENFCLVAVLLFLVREVAYEVLASHEVMIHEASEQNVSFHLNLSS
jgi:hypothetical protein